jgi:hypothetical protein
MTVGDNRYSCATPKGFEEPITAEEHINVDGNVMTGGLTDEEEPDKGITRP